MIKFPALNTINNNNNSKQDDSDIDDSDYSENEESEHYDDTDTMISDGGKKKKSKFSSMSIEAQEAYNMKLYENALRFQQNNDYLQAQQSYQELLTTPMIAKIKPTSKKSILSSTMATLKYSTLKNMANINEAIDNKELALKLSTEAIDLDGRDISLWYSIGKIAMDLEKWNISRYAFERVLSISSYVHWLSLEKLIELLYIINDDDSCCQIIDQRIFIEQPTHLKATIIKLLIQRHDQSKYSEINQVLTCIVKSNPSSVAYIQSLIKKKDKVQSKINSNASYNVSKQTLDPPTQHTLNTATWSSLLDLLGTIYVEKKESSSSLSIYSPIEIVLNPLIIIDQPIDEPMIIENQQSTINTSTTSTTTTTTTSVPDVIVITETPIVNAVETTTIAAESTTTILSSSTSSIIVAATAVDEKTPLSPPTQQPLNSSNGSVNNTTARIAPVRRIETRSKASSSSKVEDKVIVEQEEYLDKLINSNRPISQDVLNQLATNNTTDELNKLEKEKNKQATTTTTNNNKNNDQQFLNNEQSSIIQLISKMNQMTNEQPNLIVSVIEWMTETLNTISAEATKFKLVNYPSLNNKIFKIKSIIDQNEVSSSSSFQDYYLLLSELSFDRYQTFKIEKEKKQQQKLKKSQPVIPVDVDIDLTVDGEDDTISKQQTTTVPPPKVILKENDQMYKPNNELSNLSYYLELLNLKKFIKPFKLLKDSDGDVVIVEQQEQDDQTSVHKELLFEIRYKWLLANYNLVVMGNVHMATLYFREIQELFQDYNNRGFKTSSSIQSTLDTLVISHCKFEGTISQLIISDKISHLQDQQEKNSAGQLFNSKNYNSVITLLEPLFSDSLCVVEFVNGGSTFNNSNMVLEFKTKDHIDSDTKSKLNRIDLLIQSYLNISDIKGVLKMSIILLKELSNFINHSETVNFYIVLINKIFHHENMKSTNLDETQSTLLSILVKILYKFYKKNQSYSSLKMVLDVYQFDKLKKLKSTQLMSIFSMLHGELSKKRQCLDEPKFMMDYIDLLFKFLIKNNNNDGNGSGDGDLNLDELSTSSSSVNNNNSNNNLESFAIKVITELSQCYHCLYSIRLTSSCEDHQNGGCNISSRSNNNNTNTNNRQLKSNSSPNVYLQLFILLKLLCAEEEDITNIQLNPLICNDSITTKLQSMTNKKDIKELTEKIYHRFPKAPTRVTRFKEVIDDYLINGTLKELTDDLISVDIVSPPILNLNLLSIVDSSLTATSTSPSSPIDNPIFDDIYTDIYYMYAMQFTDSKKEEQCEQYRNLIIKDLYCNPNRIDSWQLLSKSYSEEMTTLKNSRGIMVNYDFKPTSSSSNNRDETMGEGGGEEITAVQQGGVEIEEDDEEDIVVSIDRLYGKLKLIYKQISKLIPKEESFKKLASLIYEKHYFIRNDDTQAYRVKLHSIFTRSLFYLNKAIEVEQPDKDKLTSVLHQVFKSKLEKKLGQPPSIYMGTLFNIIQKLPLISKTKTMAVHPLYRLHTERLKLLLSLDNQDSLPPLDNELLSTLEQFNFQFKSNSSSSSSSSVLNTLTDEVDDEDTDNITSTESNDNIGSSTDDIIPSTATTLTTTVPVEELSLEARRDLIIDNSLAVLVHIRSIISHHHTSSFRIAWTIRCDTRKENNISNSLAEFIRLVKPKLSRLTKGCIWSLWNDYDIGEGKMDRFFSKYYKLFIQLLQDNNDIKNLENIYIKIKNDKKFQNEASICFLSCCKVLSNVIKIKKEQKEQQLQLSQNNNNNNTISTSNTSAAIQSLDIESILKYEWEFYFDLSLFPQHKSVIQKLIVESWIFGNSTASPTKKSQPSSFDEIIKLLENKFVRFDRRKKKPVFESQQDSKRLKTDNSETDEQTE